MISISQKIKEELSALEPADAASALAELSAVLSAGATLGICNIGYYVEASGGGPYLKARVDVLLKKLYGLVSDEGPVTGLKNQGGAFRVTGEAAERCLEDCQILVRGGEGLLKLERGVDRYLVEDDAAARGYLAGAFIAAGALSVSQSGTGYHLELSVESERLADGLGELLRRFEIYAKRTLRKGKVILYLKDGGQICDFLALAGASQAVLELNDLLARKSLNNGVNRRTNCEEANIGRAVDAASRQLAAVKALSDRGRLDALPEGLRAAARARLKHPELGMAELGALMRPPIGKSGVNHRFEKLIEMAERLRNEK